MGSLDKGGSSGSGDVASDEIFDAKGDLAVGTGADTAARLAVGANDLVLTADSGQATGLKWAAPSITGGDLVDTDTIWDAKGDLAAGTGANTASKLTVGANDTILMADSGQATGLKWVAAATPAAVSTAAAEGTADTFTRGDHVHAHEAAHLAHDTAWAAAGDLIVGTGNDTAAIKTKGATGTFVRATGSDTVFEAIPISVGACFEGAPPSNGARRIWTAPFAATVTDIQVLVIGGTSATINAQKNTSDIRTADATINAGTDYASAAGSLQNTDFAVGDDLAVEIVSTSGAVTFVGIQINMTRP